MRKVMRYLILRRNMGRHEAERLRARSRPALWFSYRHAPFFLSPWFFLSEDDLRELQGVPRE